MIEFSHKTRTFAKIAAVAMVAGVLALPGSAEAQPSRPHFNPNHFCFGPVCFDTGSRSQLGFAPKSEGHMPSTCNGELGFWDEIPMPGGKVYCLARSLYQPTPGDWSLTSVPTCTKTVHHRRQEEQSTTDGACQAPKHDDHDGRGR